ncbi:MAG: amidohydrolase family protein [Burkholderiaceae bacterium]|nr:amidohydrolase family protein [Burkholderiaceae bacterium]MBP7659759.1 amidohydrolase family protein [Burkholderiaceae bacterium]
MTALRSDARLAFTRATVFDSTAGCLRPGATVVVRGEQIEDVLYDATPVHDARVVDLAGRSLLPGLIDAHVHITATSARLLDLTSTPPSLVAAQAKDILWGMLMRGFTTVRDAAGADFGLVEAVRRDIFQGPRLFIAGHALSQTGGHGDGRPMGAHRLMCTCESIGVLGIVADGVSAVRRAAREQLRGGAHHLKIMAGGGVASPTDPIDGTQYSVDELCAICEEAEAANTYAMAHAYTPRAISRAVRAGVKTIEHGNMLDAASAQVMREHGAALVPTLVTYDALAGEGKALHWPATMLEKLERVRALGVESLRIAQDAGVEIGFGTDLLGHMHTQQSHEFALRLPAMPMAQILQSATAVNARFMRQEGRLGVIARGALADLIVVDGDPLAEPSLLAGQGEALRLVMKGGRIYNDELQTQGERT